MDNIEQMENDNKEAWTLVVEMVEGKSLHKRVKAMKDLDALVKEGKAPLHVITLRNELRSSGRLELPLINRRQIVQDTAKAYDIKMDLWF